MTRSGPSAFASRSLRTAVQLGRRPSVKRTLAVGANVRIRPITASKKGWSLKTDWGTSNNGQSPSGRFRRFRATRTAAARSGDPGAGSGVPAGSSGSRYLPAPRSTKARIVRRGVAATFPKLLTAPALGPDALAFQQNDLLRPRLVGFGEARPEGMLHAVRGHEVVDGRPARRDGVAPEADLYRRQAAEAEEVPESMTEGPIAAASSLLVSAAIVHILTAAPRSISSKDDPDAAKRAPWAPRACPRRPTRPVSRRPQSAGSP